MAHRGGRPSKLNPVVKEKLLTAIKNGHLLKDASNFAGISYQTLCEWIRRGRGNHHRPQTREFAEFANEFEVAESIARMKFVENWKNHFSNSWQAIAAYMAVRWPDDYGNKVRVNANPQEQAMANATEAKIERQLREDPESRELIKQFCRRGQAFAADRQD